MTTAAAQPLTSRFNYFFKRINPSLTFEQQAASEYGSVKSLIESRTGPAAVLAPICFLQGSYRQETAIYTINDVDIVVLCELWQPGSGSGGNGGRSWTRDAIFDTVAAPLRADARYRDKIRYHAGSMCIKVDLGIKLEILPVVYKAGNVDPAKEPFRLYRPRSGQWEDGYARYHQGRLTEKNRATRTGGNFVPAIKVLKHLRSKWRVDAVSFHIECLVYNLPDYLFLGGPADYIPAVLGYIAATPAADWYAQVVRTPCQERDIFTAVEWSRDAWFTFHENVTVWAKVARLANQASDPALALEAWQTLLGKEFFPTTVSP